MGLPVATNYPQVRWATSFLMQRYLERNNNFDSEFIYYPRYERVSGAVPAVSWTFYMHKDIDPDDETGRTVHLMADITTRILEQSEMLENGENMRIAEEGAQTRYVSKAQVAVTFYVTGTRDVVAGADLTVGIGPNLRAESLVFSKIHELVPEDAMDKTSRGVQNMLDAAGGLAVVCMQVAAYVVREKFSNFVSFIAETRPVVVDVNSSVTLRSLPFTGDTLMADLARFFQRNPILTRELAPYTRYSDVPLYLKDRMRWYIWTARTIARMQAIGFVLQQQQRREDPLIMKMPWDAFLNSLHQ